MNTEFSISTEVYDLAAEEAAWYYRLLLHWLDDTREKQLKDIDSNDIKKLYRIHKKLHHRLLIILLWMMKDKNDLIYAHKYNQAWISEQKELLQIMIRLRPKSLLQVFKWWMEIPRYMERIGIITTDILDEWWLTEQWDRLVYSPIK